MSALTDQPNDHSLDPRPATESVSASDRPDEALIYACHPLRRRPLAAVIVAVFIMMCGFAVFESTDSRALAVLTLVALYLSVAKFYLPTRYQLDNKGVTIKTTTQKIFKEWSVYRSFYPDKNGVLLSPFVEPTRLENFRGLYLMYNDNSETVLAFIKAHISASEPTDEVTK